MRINKKYLPIKAHYFFLFAGVAPLLPFIPVYANTKLGISYAGVGIVYTILPFLALIAKATSGMLADYLHAHRAVFLTSITVCGLGFFSIYFTNPLPKNPNPDPAHIKLDCSRPSSYLRYDVAKERCGAQDFVDGIQANDSATCEVDCPSTPEIVKELCNYWNISASQCETVLLKFSAYTPLSHMDQEKLTSFFPIYNLSYFGTEVEHPICDEKILINCTARCDNEPLMSFLGAPSEVFLPTFYDIIAQHQFWSFFLCLAVAWCGFAISTVMSDTICFQILGPEGSLYGKQRLFGSIGWGLSVTFAGYLVDLRSGGSLESDYTPAYILSICLMTLDFVVATRLKMNPGERQPFQAKSVFNVLSEPQIAIFVLCCILVGLSTMVLWTFQLILVQEVAYTYDCHFEHMKLLQGLIMGVQCVGGEIPFFFLSGVFIKKLGHVYAMALVIASFGVRYIAYYFVVNPWLFLPIELLNGPTFGLFYATMTSYASMIAPPGADATMQGLFGASFEGLGMSIGGFVGGALYTVVGGGSTFMYVGIMNLFFCALYVIVQILLNKFRPANYQLTSTVSGEEHLHRDDSHPSVGGVEEGDKIAN